MNKYKIEFTQKETFIVDVLAKNEAEAHNLAMKNVRLYGLNIYNQIGDTETEISNTYNVSTFE